MTSHRKRVYTQKEDKVGFQKWIVQIEVDDSWVAEGVDLTRERMQDMVGHGTGAHNSEIKVKIIHHPDVKVIRKLQGYAPTATGLKRKKGIPL